MSLNFIKAWRNDKYNKRVLIWHFTSVLIKINYGQIGDQTGLFYTINPVFHTSGNRFVRRTGTFGNLIFSLVPLDNRNTRSTCPTYRTNVNVEAWFNKLVIECLLMDKSHFVFYLENKIRHHSRFKMSLTCNVWILHIGSLRRFWRYQSGNQNL